MWILESHLVKAIASYCISIGQKIVPGRGFEYFLDCIDNYSIISEK